MNNNLENLPQYRFQIASEYPAAVAAAESLVAEWQGALPVRTDRLFYNRQFDSLVDRQAASPDRLNVDMELIGARMFGEGRHPLEYRHVLTERTTLGKGGGNDYLNVEIPFDMTGSSRTGRLLGKGQAPLTIVPRMPMIALRHNDGPQVKLSSPEEQGDLNIEADSLLLRAFIAAVNLYHEARKNEPLWQNLEAARNQAEKKRLYDQALTDIARFAR